MKPLTVLLPALLAFLAAGCSTLSSSSSPSAKAPVETRGGQQVETTQAKPVSGKPAQAGKVRTYEVKKGDTVYSIARENNVNAADIITWNNLAATGYITVGQVLTLGPIEDASTVTTKKITPPPPVREVTAEDLAGSSNSKTVKTSPRGGIVAYSEESWGKIKNAPTQAVTTAVPGTATTTGSTAPSAPAATSGSELTKPANTGADQVDWGWPANSPVIAHYANQSGKQAMKGIALSGKLGDPVRAAAAGKVVYVGGNLRGYGNLVIVRHNSTYLTAYAHNNKIFVKEGEQVSRGQKIAEFGKSDADSVKLHFEIRKNGRPIDPEDLLPKR